MKLSVDFGRWTRTKAALAVAGALAMVGAVGSALAISPIIAPPIKWQGGWEIIAPGVPGGASRLYTVPTGKSLLISDIAIANNSEAVRTFALSSSNSTDCNAVAKVRMVAHTVPPFSSLIVPLQSGIGFGSGQSVCSQISSGFLNVNFRGFLFTPN